MSVQPPVGPPQELLDWLASQGVDPAQVNVWNLLVYALRRQNKLAQAIQQVQAQVNTNTTDIATLQSQVATLQRQVATIDAKLGL